MCQPQKPNSFVSNEAKTEDEATLEDGDEAEADKNESLCWLDFLFEVGGQTTFFQLISGVNLAHGMMQLTRANLSLSPRLISSQCDKMLE